MGVDRVLEVGGQGGHLHCQYALGDQFAGAATGNADAEDAVGRGVYEQLGHPVVGILGRGAAGGGPGEARDFARAPLFFGLFLSEAAPGDFRVGLDHVGDGVGLEDQFVVAGDDLGD